MKKLLLTNWTAMVFLIALATSCQEEPLRFQSGDVVDCSGCEDLPPGGGTVVTYCPDLIVSNIVAPFWEGDRLSYRVYIKNIGNSIANINLNDNWVQISGSLSIDGIIWSAPAGGTLVRPMALGVNQTTYVDLGNNFSLSKDKNTNDYHYLVVTVSVSSRLGECDMENNTNIKLI